MRISDLSSDVFSSDLADDLLIATPSHVLRTTLEQLKPLLREGQGLIAACKGLEPKSGKLVHEVIEEVLGHRHPFGVLSGPTFAKELGIGLPTAVPIASRSEARRVGKGCVRRGRFRWA